MEIPASEMTDEQIASEMASLEVEWRKFQSKCDGAAGSPGEWMFERMDELETEKKRRVPCGPRARGATTPYRSP